MDWTDVEMELSSAGREDLVLWVDAQSKRLLMIEQSAINLCKVRGRHHSEIAMNRLLKDCGQVPTITEMRNILNGV